MGRLSRARSARAAHATVVAVRGPYAKGDPPNEVEVLDAPESLAEVLLKADIAVVGAGQTMLEAAAAGTPTVSIVLVDNQRRQAEGLAALEAVVLADPRSLASEVVARFLRFRAEAPTERPRPGGDRRPGRAPSRRIGRGARVKVAVLGLGSAGRRHAENARALGHEVVGFDPADPSTAASMEEAIAESDAVVVASPGDERSPMLSRPSRRCQPASRRWSEGAARRDRRRCGARCQSRPRRRRRLRRRDEPSVPPRDPGSAGPACGAGELRFARSSFGYDLRLWRPGTDYRASYSAQAALGGGILLDAIHELDYLLWLLGPVESVAAELDRVSELEIDVEDTALLSLRFASGALGAVDLNFVEPSYRRECLLVGSSAVAHWDWNRGKITVRRVDGERTVDVTCDVQETYRAVLEDFLAGGEPRTSAAAGVDALRVVAAARRAAAYGIRQSVNGAA